MEKLKYIAWHLVSTQLVLAVVIIFCPCLCGNLGAETARKFLTPDLSPSTEPAVNTEHHFKLRAPSPCRPSPLLLCSGISRPGNPGHCPWLVSPSPLLRLMPAFPGTQAAENSCSCYPRLQLLLRIRAAGFSGAPSQDCFFPTYPWKFCWAVPTAGMVSAAPCVSPMLLLRDPLYSGSSWVTQLQTASQ